MIPIKLKLRGSIGIYEGLGLDEVTLDFSGYQSGLIALVGDNGVGKTTVLENLHPYSMLASRKGGLYRHFRLKDSCRDYIFRAYGKDYRSLIMIDAHTGKTAGYLYENEKPLNKEGTMSSYEVAVNNLFGTPDVFFKSVFMAQKRKGMIESPPAERKQLFYDLLSEVFSKYEKCAETAKVKADSKEKEALVIQGRIAEFNRLIAREGDIQTEKKQSEENEQKIQKSIDALKLASERIQKKIRETELALAKLEEKLKQKESVEKEIHQIKVAISGVEEKHEQLTAELVAKKKAIQKEIERCERVIQNRDLIETNCKLIEFLRFDLEESQGREGKLGELLLALEAKTSEYKQAVNEQKGKVADLKLNFEQQRSEIQRTISEEKNTRELMVSKLNVMKSDLESSRNAASLIDKVPCKDVSDGIGLIGERCQFLTDATKAKAGLTNEEKLCEILAKEIESFPISTWTIQIEELKKKLDNDIAAVGVPEEPETTALKTEITEVRKQVLARDETAKQLQLLLKANWPALRDELLKANSILEAKQGELADLEKRLDKAVLDFVSDKSELEVRRTKKENELSSFDDFQRTVKVLKANVLGWENDFVQHTGNISVEESELKNVKVNTTRFEIELQAIEKSKAELDKVVEEAQGLIRDYEALRFIQKACSKEGIPALEIDLAGADVSQIANELLAGTFGTSYQIMFNTVEPTADGKKQKETFTIKVFGENGTEVDVDNLSGGQQVWVDKAITEAVAIYLTEKSGKEYLTSFADEMDGKLSQSKKNVFLQLLNESFRRGNRHFTFLITQTPDVWEQIQQRIVFYSPHAEMFNAGEGRIEYKY